MVSTRCMPLKATFVRVIGERDRVYVTRSNGSQVSWVFATYGDGLPHDLVHLVVESVFGLTQGFWGRVDGGADPGRISADANRRGGENKFAAFGDDRSELDLAEALAAAGWDSVESVREACARQNVAPPQDLSEELVEETAACLGALQRRWVTLVPKGAIDVSFDTASPRRSIPTFRRLET